ncbi:MAG: response regulator transcription factor [Chloroflexi bacterium]|nr:response regulator transcription factor [Chloroflexota bacterium]MBK6712165.1 response regulator transcription factor [Chloroflexota bacterium]MBK7178642.1 response regulator transcription factor [Chloroflexota bacterium]MBK7920127.1 response regulator transcription factor [Chloroflexota bacterium]MBK8932138.1 response regulator transcription factor [Chloroflexota bacterium]
MNTLTELGDILVVDDEASVVEVVSLYLKREGFQVRVARDGRQALEAVRQQLPALVVLDLMLPEVDGLSILRELRGDTAVNVPVIMLTARQQETDRIYGLELGADDYVTKPFSPAELVSRVKAVLRRSAGTMGNEGGQRPLTFTDLAIDPNTRLVTVRGKNIELTATEFNLLWFMASHPRQVFKRDQLLEKVWGFSEYVDPSTVTVHIRRLREKIEIDPGNPVWLATVWGVGYKFEPG